MLHYEKHQRDYTLLGTNVVFQAFMGKEMVSYYDYTPNPLFVLVKKGILYHFSAREDMEKWSQHWMKKYGTAKELRHHKMKHDQYVKSYNHFRKEKITNPLVAIQKLNSYLEHFTPIITAVIGIPEHIPNLDPDLLELCMQIRKENENTIKFAFDFHQELLEKAEKEHLLSSHTLENLTVHEFNDFVKTKMLPTNISSRKRFVLVRHTHGKEEVFLDEKEMRRFDFLQNEKNLNELTEIKGKVAYPGKAKGIVRIIKKIEDAGNLHEGEILVTGMTDPRYLPLMKKAAAIITDEGGITSHAAIVAREMKKPCIIGTKNATHALHEGQMVEVDANKGIVRILHR